MLSNLDSFTVVVTLLQVFQLLRQVDQQLLGRNCTLTSSQGTVTMVWWFYRTKQSNYYGWFIYRYLYGWKWLFSGLYPTVTVTHCQSWWGPDQSICEGTQTSLLVLGLQLVDNEPADGEAFTPTSTTTAIWYRTGREWCSNTDQAIITKYSSDHNGWAR